MTGKNSKYIFSDWPWKVFQVSYLLYPVLAAGISILVGILVSFLTSLYIPRYRNKKPLSSLIHPLVRDSYSGYTVPDSKDYKEFVKGEQKDEQNVSMLEIKNKLTTS